MLIARLRIHRPRWIFQARALAKACRRESVTSDLGGTTYPAIPTSGLRIYGDANDSWVATRKIWNQHAYHAVVSPAPMRFAVQRRSQR